MIKTTILTKPNTTNTSMSYLFYTSIYELTLTPLGPKVAYAATSSVTTTLAGRPRLTAPPFNSALAANSAKRI